MNSQKLRTRLLVTVVIAAFAAVGCTATDKSSSNSQDTNISAAKSQKQLDFEHQLLQSDGYNHLLETVKGREAVKNRVVARSSAPKTQKDLDFEHQLLQSDGYNHVLETVKGNEATKNKSVTAKASAPKTQKQLDFEHDLMQSDGFNHLREVLKK